MNVYIMCRTVVADNYIHAQAYNGAAPKGKRKGFAMKIEAHVFDGRSNESIVVYNDIDLESIVNDLQISFDNWMYASIECEGETYIAYPDGLYELYELHE